MSRYIENVRYLILNTIFPFQIFPINEINLFARHVRSSISLSGSRDGAVRPADYLDLDLDLFLGEALRDLLFDLLLDLLFERLLERDLLLDLALESRLRLLDRDFDLDLDLDRDLDLDLDLDRDFRLLRSSVSRIRLSTKKVAFIG